MTATSAIAQGFPSAAVLPGRLPRKPFRVFAPFALALPVIVHLIADGRMVSRIAMAAKALMEATPFLAAPPRRLQGTGLRVWPAAALFVPILGTITVFVTLLSTELINGIAPDPAPAFGSFRIWISGPAVSLGIAAFLLLYILIACSAPGQPAPDTAHPLNEVTQ